ncbi:hypothetical protein [Sphingobacterium zeae]|uniref:hypothetical protein n=1 Tax=Sphingobacterium zeae TaxID=1776859 RepID=UPI003613953D
MKQTILIWVFIFFSLAAFSAQGGEIYVGKQSNKEKRDGTRELHFHVWRMPCVRLGNGDD